MLIVNFCRAILPWALALLIVPAADAGEISKVEQGRRLFFAETFQGNGRTCGTCHPADNNYTIDPAYIARLPATDPLFVNVGGLENPTLLRGKALILVHADGFAKPGVLRGVPTLLGISQALAVEPGSLIKPGSGADLVAATGWSGDGAPGTGSLREFATGAIREHLTKDIRRRENIDFRLPTSDELAALEAFMLTLGRHEELDIAPETGVTFRSKLVELGRQPFTNERSGQCAFCHRNATALNKTPANGMFDIGVNRRQLNRDFHPTAASFIT